VASVPNSDLFIITGKKKKEMRAIYLYHINTTKYLFIHLYKTYLQILCVFIPFISGTYILRLIYLLNCNWVANWWQQYSTHLHTNNTQNDTKQTIHRTTLQFLEECRLCPIFANYTLAFALQLRKKHGKTSVRHMQLNNEAHSHNHCCSGRTISVKHFKCVCILALTTQQANHIILHRIILYCHLWPVWLYHIFFHIIL
jgi:hypothetical protein